YGNEEMWQCDVWHEACQSKIFTFAVSRLPFHVCRLPKRRSAGLPMPAERLYLSSQSPKMKWTFLIAIALSSVCGQPVPKNGEKKVESEPVSTIRTGAEQTEKYLPLLRGKRVAIMANPTAIIGNVHLVDSLQRLGVNIVKVFGPEHGFRGNVSAG